MKFTKLFDDDNYLNDSVESYSYVLSIFSFIFTTKVSAININNNFF